MKMTINVDCTPEEARRFLGFPDLGPVHEIYVERLKSAATDGLNPEMVANMLKNWGPFSENAMKLFAGLFQQGSRPG